MQIKWLGVLNNGKINEELWSGSISLKDKPADKMEPYKDLLPTFYKSTSPNAAVRCIDGRPAEKSPTVLGPQVAGGSPGLALAFLVSTSSKDDVIANYVKFLKQNLGYVHGAHIDDHAAEPNCGCGAIDKMAQKIQKIQNSSQEIKPFVQTIMDQDFDEETYKKAIDLFKGLDPNNLLPNNYRGQLIKLTSENKGSVEKVTGQHKELAVLINKIPNSTFDKDAFDKKTNNNAQAFGFDYWFAKQASSGNLEYLTAIVTYQVAAAMVLTDGSLAIGIRQ